MKSRSAKAKGRRLQQKVRDLLLEKFSEELEPDDIRSAIMGESGEDLKLSPAARKLIPYSFELLLKMHHTIKLAFHDLATHLDEHFFLLMFYKLLHQI